MQSYQPALRETASAGARMDALCEFIEFWLGPRQSTFGESASALRKHSLPIPLKRLYEFAGRWPHWEDEGPVEYSVPALSHQDSLAALDRLKYEEDGKVVFLHENQAVWDCRTLSSGEDPPVWCYGEQVDEQENYFVGEKLVCASLSTFLVTFVLQELTLGSRFHVCDAGLSARFESAKDSAVAVWLGGPYAHGSYHDYYLWGDVLVGNVWGDFFFAANHQEGIDFLKKNQGPVKLIGLMVGQPWRLDIRSDGSASIQYLTERTQQTAEVPVGSFNFPDILASLSAEASDEGHFDRNPMVFFRREGQSGGVRAKHLHNNALVTALFQLAIEKAIKAPNALKRRFSTKWPL